MSTLFKDLYSESFVNDFAKVVKSLQPSFDSNSFTKKVFSDEWSSYELKQRMRHISLQLIDKAELENVALLSLIKDIKHSLATSAFAHNGIEFMFLPDVVELIGQDHFDKSIEVMEDITEFITCEFAVRPFIIKYNDKMMDQMVKWSRHENHHVRRLSSEGCRPRLPWAIALPEFKKDPKSILPILTELKNDTSEYVRRSVANNLNDISKDHPDKVMTIAQKWKGESENTDRLLKHALRTLLKSNYPGVMQYVGYADPAMLEISNFESDEKVAVGNKFNFSFQLKNKSKVSGLVRLEYAIYFLLSNGQKGKKVFKISERQINANECVQINKYHSFRKITTRTYYTGEQELSIIVCGEEKSRKKFLLS